MNFLIWSNFFIEQSSKRKNLQCNERRFEIEKGDQKKRHKINNWKNNKRIKYSFFVKYKKIEYNKWVKNE
jgi:hypothetical protein